MSFARVPYISHDSQSTVKHRFDRDARAAAMLQKSLMMPMRPTGWRARTSVHRTRIDSDGTSLSFPRSPPHSTSAGHLIIVTGNYAIQRRAPNGHNRMEANNATIQL
jgi:hypothetical protein